MMAGRCISGDFIAHASYRVTGNATSMGGNLQAGANVVTQCSAFFDLALLTAQHGLSALLIRQQAPLQRSIGAKRNVVDAVFLPACTANEAHRQVLWRGDFQNTENCEVARIGSQQDEDITIQANHFRSNISSAKSCCEKTGIKTLCPVRERTCNAARGAADSSGAATSLATGLSPCVSITSFPACTSLIRSASCPVAISALTVMGRSYAFSSRSRGL